MKPFTNDLKKLTITIMLVFCTITSYASSASRDAWGLWKKGFNIYESGEDQMLKGNDIKSLELFKKALSQFKGISKKYPKWKTKIISYRIGLCKRKIKSINKKISVKSGEGKLETGNTSIVATAMLSTQLEQLKNQLDQYKNKFYTTSAELEIEKKQSEKYKKASDQLQIVLKEKANIEVECSLLKRKLNDLSKKKDISSGSHNIDNKEISELQKKLASSEVQKEKLRIDYKKLSEKNSQIEASIRLYKAQIAKAQERAKSDEETVIATKKMLDQIAKQKDKLQTELDKSNANASRYKDIISDKETTIAELEKQLKDLREKCDVNGVTKQLQDDNERLNSSNKKLNANLQELLNERDDLKLKISKSVANVVALNENLDSERDKVKELTSKINDLESKVKQLELNKDNDNYKEVVSKNESLKAQINELTKNFAMLHTLLELNKKEYSQKQNQFKIREAQLKEQLEQATSKLNILMSNSPESKNKSELLQKIDLIGKLKGEVFVLNQETALKDKQLNKVNSEKNELELQFIALKKQLKDSPKTIDNNTQLKFLKEIESLTNKLAYEKKLNEKLTKNTNTESLKEIIKEKEKQIDELTKNLRKSNISETKNNAPASSLESDTELLKTTKAESAARKQISIINKTYKRKLDAAQKRYDILNDKLKKTLSMSKTYKANLTNLTKRFDKLVASIKSNTTAMALQAEETNKAKAELEQLKKENNKLKSLVKGYDIEKLVADNKHLKQSLDLMKIENSNMETKIQELEKIKINPDVDLFVRQIKRKNTAVDQLIKQIEELKVDNEELTANFEEIERKMDLRNEKIMQYKALLDNKTKNFEKLADLKNKLKKELDKLKTEK